MVFDATDALMGLLGGLLIGCAAALMLLMNGRIAGISGLAGVVVRPLSTEGAGEKLAFLAGLIAAPAVYALVVAPPAIGTPQTPWILVAGGLLVGIGTRMGGGCTSGHGVCGMSRFSGRSFAATAVFMAMGVAVATLAPTLLAG